MSVISNIEKRVKQLREVVIEEELDNPVNESSVDDMFSFMRTVIRNNKEVIYPSVFLQYNGNIKITYHNKENDTFSIEFFGGLKTKIFYRHKNSYKLHVYYLNETMKFFNGFYEDFMEGNS